MPISNRANHNYALSDARALVERAITAREAAIVEDPSLAGPSLTRLMRAYEDLMLAKTFAGEGERNEELNPFRNGERTPRFGNPHRETARA